MNIVFLDAKTIGDVQGLKKISELGNLVVYKITQKNERIERIKNAHIVITNKVIIDKEVIDACPQLRLICIAATGMNNVDLEYARQRNIAVRNVSGYSTESVAQSTFAMLFYLLNHSRYFDEYVKSGSYSQSDIFTHHGRKFRELKGKTFGIIGLGNIGKRVAEIAAVFGAGIVFYSTSGKNTRHKLFRHLALSELLAVSDVVSVHCPLNDRTRGLLDYERLRLMKPGAFLINTGRGGIVSEPDLARALNENLIAGAALDVLESEPVSEGNPLLRIAEPEKLFITPHIAWTSIESREMLIGKIRQDIEEFLNA